jgi:glycosyltransferase involved in cell wall biosynthesis
MVTPTAPTPTGLGRLRIGLYGGVANNMYVFAHAFARAGHTVRFIRERAERFAFSQPVWEDVALAWTQEDMTAASQGSWDAWSATEARVGWQAPSWLIDPWTTGFPAWMAPFRQRVHWAACQAMRQCDIVLVCGIDATLLAWLSGRPYVVWPHGGDIRFAAGIDGNQSTSPVTATKRRLLRRAYQQALWVGTHDPTGVGGHLGDLVARMTDVRFRRLAIPMRLQPRLAADERRSQRSALLAELGLPPVDAPQVAVIPSRLDFEWKGHDRLIAALALLPADQRPYLIASGWGRHQDDMRGQIAEAGLLDRISFLPGPVSKPLLYRLFQSADFAIDQFCMGSYGTAAVEAMSVGTPVMMHIAGAAFAARGWEAPPVLNADRPETIAALLSDLATGKCDLDAASIAVTDWMSRVHAEQSVVDTFVADCQAAITGAR